MVRCPGQQGARLYAPVCGVSGVTTCEHLEFGVILKGRVPKLDKNRRESGIQDSP